MPDHGSTTRSAFTIIEMLVVIAIMSLLLLIAFPTINMMQRLTGTTAGLNTISVGVVAARHYATRRTVDLSAVDPTYAGLNYSGAALLVTPAREMRLVESDQLAEDGNGELLQQNTEPFNGYKDIDDAEYITMPKRTGIVGLMRNNDETMPSLFTPPFAIVFNNHGQLVVGQPSDDTGVALVVYDGDGNGAHEVTDKRKSTYDPDDWQDIWNDTANKFELPFEVIDSVVGVIVFEETDLRAAQASDGGNLNLKSSGNTGPLNSDARDWILENGTPVFFNRYTGAPMRE